MDPLSLSPIQDPLFPLLIPGRRCCKVACGGAASFVAELVRATGRRCCKGEATMLPMVAAGATMATHRCYQAAAAAAAARGHRLRYERTPALLQAGTGVAARPPPLAATTTNGQGVATIIHGLCYNLPPALLQAGTDIAARPSPLAADATNGHDVATIVHVLCYNLSSVLLQAGTSISARPPSLAADATTAIDVATSGTPALLQATTLAYSPATAVVLPWEAAVL